MLEELGLPYQLIMLPFPPRVERPAVLEINPLGTMPLMLDGQTRMVESAAICQYLCERAAPTSLAVAPSEPDYGVFLNGLHFGEATLTVPQTLVLRYARFEPEERRQTVVAQDYTRWFLARLRTLEPTLLESDCLCAGRFAAADVSVGFALLAAQHLGLVDRFTPGVRQYWERLQARDGYQRALRAQHEAALSQGVSTTPAPDL